ncbi:MAG: acyl-CoA thioesterase/BAAT N-terminal domain-containing protein [Tissierellia bacterium]|nr:acyl-CoA thioesterase/BAAT N-terminal domain-containing protein [Tissierellia bacterium]
MIVEYKELSNFSDSTDVKISDLKPNQTVIIKLDTKIGNNAFNSAAKFDADEDGNLILNETKAYDGYYEGIIKEGLLMTLSGIQNPIFSWGDAKRPCEFMMTIETQDHFQNRYDPKAQNPIALSKNNQKLEEDDELKIIKFKKSYDHGLNYEKIDKNRAHLHVFTEDFNNPIILIFSSAQKKYELDKAAFFAKNGYTAVCCQYFAAEYLNPNPSQIPVEIFEDIKDALSEKYNIEKIDLFGNTEGAGLCVLIAAKYPEFIEKLVLFSPHYYVFQGIDKKAHSLYTIDDKDVPFIPFKIGFFDQLSLTKKMLLKQPVSLTQTYDRCIQRAKNRIQAQLPYKDVKNPILIVYGQEDKLNDVERWTENIKQDRNDLKTEVISKQNCGHYINAPYNVQYPKGGLSTTFGGDIASNAKNSSSLYEEILEFLNK